MPDVVAYMGVEFDPASARGILDRWSLEMLDALAWSGSREPSDERRAYKKALDELSTAVYAQEKGKPSRILLTLDREELDEYISDRKRRTNG